MLDNQSKIIKKFIFSCSSNVCFLRIPQNFLTEELKKDFVLFDVSKDFSPYKPFFSVLSQNDCKPDENLISKVAYSVQKNSFLSYFKDGIADCRYDIPLTNEIVYEQGRYIKSIVEFLESLPQKNYLILNCQCISAQGVDLIKAIEKSNVKSRFAFCFASAKNEMEQNAANRLLEEYSSKPNYLYLMSSTMFIAQDRTEFKLILDLPVDEQYKIIYKTLRNNRIFMDIEQLKDFSLWVSANFGKFAFEESEKRVMSLELAKALFECDLIDEAILYLNDIIDVQEDDRLEGIALYYLARAFAFKKSTVLAKKYSALAEKNFLREKNAVYLALNAMLDFHVAKRVSAEDTMAKYKKALQLLKEQELVNNYISVCISVPWRLMNDKAAREGLDSEVDQCLQIAEKIDNQHLVSTACHWKGIIASHFGEIDKALEWYDKCNAIRTKIGEIGPILNIRNGLCYDATCRALYKRAYNLENDFIEHLYNVSDFSTVTDTLKNISYALFYSRHFSEAYEIFNAISRYLQIFNMLEMANSSFLPSQSDILIFKSIISFDQLDFIRGRINHANIMQNFESVTKEDKPLVYLVEAILAADEKDINASESFFKKCIEEFNQIKSKMAHKIVFACYEYAVALKRLGYEKQSEKYMSLGFELAAKEGFAYYTKGAEKSGKKSISVDEYLNGVEAFEPLKLNLEILNGKAEKEQLLTLLHKRIHDYQFINKVKTGNIKNMNLKKYIQTVLFDIQEYTLAEEVCFGVMENGKAEINYFTSKNEELFVTPEMLKKLFKKSKQSNIAQMVLDEETGIYFGDETYAEYRFGIVLVPSSLSPISVDVINTLNIALVSIQSQFVIYKQEEHLMIMSSTDQLSRLKNRHAFQECIELESERVRRYMQRKETIIQIAVAFIDLDNFKYYNDTFGHNVGDLLIKSFASLLRETCRKIDFISRYGGDEFVIIMVDTDANEGARVYRRLYECLEKHQYFIPQIKSLLKIKDIEIPENRRIGFSMGISTNKDIPDCDKIDTVVQYADKALYYAKEHKKGSVAIWSEIKDKL